MLILEGPWQTTCLVLMTCRRGYSVLEACISNVLSFSVLLLEQNLYTLISVYPSMSPLSVSLWHLLSPPFLFSVSLSLILCCFIYFFLCGLFSYSLVSLSDPRWTCLTGHLSLSFSHSFAPSPSTSLSVCLLQTEQPLRASSFKPFCVAAFQPPWSWLPLLIYAHCLCLTLSFSSHFPSCSLSLSLIFPSIYALSRLRQLLLFLSLPLWLNHRAIHWSFKSLSFGAQTAKFTRGFF